MSLAPLQIICLWINLISILLSNNLVILKHLCIKGPVSRKFDWRAHSPRESLHSPEYNAPIPVWFGLVLRLLQPFEHLWMSPSWRHEWLKNFKNSYVLAWLLLPIATGNITKINIYLKKSGKNHHFLWICELYEFVPPKS